jgi:hypothetical protein
MALTFKWLGVDTFNAALARGGPAIDTLYQEAGRAWGARVAGAVGGRQASGRMAGQTGSRADNRRVEVHLGTGGLPFVGWMEFGGPRLRGSRRARRQASLRAYGGVTRAPRPYVHGGRSLYPMLAASRPSGLDAMAKGTRKFLDSL